MTDLSSEEARKLLADVVIPPRPTVVTAVLEERARPEPDLKRVAALISGDVGLSAAVLKTVNSPLYGLRRQVTSIDQAVNMLGMSNVGALVTGLALRNAVPAQGLERFWDGAARTALVASYLAKQLGCSSREDAHLFGLFHDCGIPLLMQRFPDYRDTQHQANQEHGRAFTDVEDERHATNHAVVGGLLASNWHLPDHLREAIRAHHDLAVFQSGLSSAAMNLVAIGLLAEYIESGHSRLAGDGEWDKLGGAVMAHLMMDADAVEELSRDAREMLEESGL
jgi:HD-like signal output (HDOD) protein